MDKGLCSCFHPVSAAVMIHQSIKFPILASVPAEVRELSTHPRTLSAVFSHDGKVLASGSGDATVRASGTLRVDTFVHWKGILIA